MNDGIVDINLIRKLITSYYQSVISLRRFYERPSYMGLLNVGRQELPHSSFISWLFDSTTFNQDSPDSPIMHLLDIAVKRANQQGKIGDDKSINLSLSDEIYGRRFSIAYSSCTLEEVFVNQTSSKRRCDIIIRCHLKNTERKLNFCIENKVLSCEHTSQTEAYSKYYLEEKGFKKDEDWLFLFLTPLSSVDLDNWSNLKKEDKCESEIFIQINYQDLLEHVLEPLINSVDKNSQVYFILDDYINTLRYPVMEGNEKKRTIMAIGEKETKLLNDFWEGNQKLIGLALEAMSCNTNLDSEVQEKAKAAYETIKSLQSARDSTKYVIIYDNGNKDDNKGKGYNKVDVAKKFAESFCQSSNINNEDDANRRMKDEIKTTKRKMFDKENNKTYEVILSNGKSVSLNTNIWGESTDCWCQLKKYLEKKNDYFVIAPIK